MSLPEFSIKRPVTILMASLVCILLGAISFVDIPVDLMPEIDQPTLSINIDYPGVAPEEMETLVARPLEQHGDHPFHRADVEAPQAADVDALQQTPRQRDVREPRSDPSRRAGGAGDC